MATKYLHNGLGTGANDGSSAANAWRSMADALGGVSAGDEVLSYDGGSGETLSSSPTASTSGTIGSRVKFTATNASFVVDGTYYLLDGNSAATNCLDLALKAYNVFKGFKFTGATGDGVTNFGGYSLFIDCEVYSNGGIGLVIGSSSSGTILYRVNVYSNTTHGVLSTGANNVFTYVVSNSNGSNGFWSNNISSHYRCLYYDNGADGMLVNYSSIISGCVLDDNAADGFAGTGAGNTIINTIISNNGAWGIDSGNGVQSMDTAFYLNTSGEVDDVTKYLAITPSTTLSADPYDDQAGRDYTIALGDPDLAFKERVLNTLNSSFETIGLVPQPPSATTPTFAGITKCQPDSSGKIHIEWSAGTTVSFYIVFISSSALTYNNNEQYCSRHNTRTSAIISSEADGTPLVNGTTYNIGVRAYKYSSEAFESNTTVLTMAPKGVDGQFIIKQVAGI